MDETKHYEEMYGYGPTPAPSEEEPISRLCWLIGSWEMMDSRPARKALADEAMAIVAALRSRLSEPQPASESAEEQ